eukprot:353590-Chlamydomonas_euryale.AAC.15
MLGSLGTAEVCFFLRMPGSSSASYCGSVEMEKSAEGSALPRNVLGLAKLLVFGISPLVPLRPVGDATPPGPRG